MINGTGLVFYFSFLNAPTEFPSKFVLVQFTIESIHLQKVLQ